MSNNIVQQFGAELRVSSETIAEQTENQHKNVLQLVRTYVGDLEEFGTLESETRAFLGGGGRTQYREVFHLNEPQATLLLTYMRNMERIREFKKTLVHEFYRMRQALTPAFTLPQSFSEALRELAATVESNAALEAKVTELEPKAEYVDTFVADSDLRLLRNVAKSVGMGEQELRNDLLERKWIYSESATRWSESKQEKETVIRYSPYSHKAHYIIPVPTHEAPRFRGEVMHRIKFTPAGAVAVARLYGKQVAFVEGEG